MWDGTTSQVRSFQTRTGISYPICLKASSTGQAYGVPQDWIFVVDAQGIIRYRANGVNTQEIVNVVDNLLATTAIVPQESSLPSRLELFPNFPNPFNGVTWLTFSLPESQQVVLRIFNALGKPIREIVRGVLPAGRYRFQWDGRDSKGQTVPSGIYIYQLQAGQKILAGKMVLLK